MTLGVHDIDSKFEIGRQSIEVKRIFVHPDWRTDTYSYDADISVFILKTKVQFTDYVQPICLWTAQETPEVNEGIIVGFGLTDKERTLPSTPRELKVPIVSNERCFLKTSLLAKISSLRTFCAGAADGRGPCNGDSGHGLFFKNQGKFYLRGLISSSLIDEDFTCDVSTYAVYTDVFKFKDWIAGIADE